MPNRLFALPAVLGLAVSALAQQSIVVPAAYAATDAPSYGWVAGASRDVRQQTLIGASHLTGVTNRVLTAIELRRNAIDETFLGGTANLTVTLSIAPHDAIACDRVFAANVGPSPVQVHSGPISLPTSPAHPASVVGWTAANTIRIPFSTPFVYTGGTLCVDLIGQPIAGQNANWWMADLEFEDITGTTIDLGGGCGIYGGVDKDWSYVSARTLLPGAYASFTARGQPGGIALAAFGSAASASVPLSATGLPGGTGCELWLASVTSILPTIFVPPQDPSDLPLGGRAEVLFRIPNSPATFGVSMTTQWIDWSQMATSNAVTWTVASAAPSLDMALCEGHPLESTGNATVNQAHVMRIEFQ